MAISDPLNTAVLEDLHFTTGMEVEGAIADAKSIGERVQELYGEEESLADTIAAAARQSEGGDIESAAQSAPVVRLLNSILHRAVADRANRREHPRGRGRAHAHVRLFVNIGSYFVSTCYQNRKCILYSV